MPTFNSRVNVTLPPSLFRLVSSLAEHQKCSRSQVLRELLEAAEPALQRAVALMATASKASAQVKEGLAIALDSTMDTLEGNLERELASIDQYGPDLVDLAEQGRKVLFQSKTERAAAGRESAVSRPAAAKPLRGQKRVVTPVSLTGGLGQSSDAKKRSPRGRV